MTDKLPMMLAVRGYAVPVRTDEPEAMDVKPKAKWKKRKTLRAPSDVVVVFDTETTTGHAQRLRIGTYQVRKSDRLRESGIFYEPDNVSSSELALLHQYVEGRGLVLRTRESFVREILYRHGYDYGGLILGFNLPFDLSRLATKISTSHGKDMRGGFSLELLPEKWRPNILVKHLNSRAAFIRFAAPPRPVDGRGMRRRGYKTQAKRGYFQDVKTLASALLGHKTGTLASLANYLETPHRKLETKEHGGPLTQEYLDYAIADTDVTWECYAALRKQYEAHGLASTPPHKIYSEASLGKAYLREMGVERWTKLQPDFDPELLGTIMSTYYGGRSEVRVRRRKVRVLYCDFRSMYPTVCTLMGLWHFVISTGVDYCDWTAEAIGLLGGIGVDDLRSKSTWQRLTTLVQIEPDDDVLPVRARYSGESRTIGLNYLTAKFPLWYTLADCIASKLHTGKAPRIIRAVRFTPKEQQPGLKPIHIGGNREYLIDPNQQGFDFYKSIIELRGKVQSDLKNARTECRTHDAEMLDSYQQMLKLLANSTSYGIFAEMNVQSHDRPRQVTCYGVEDASVQTGTRSVEEAGTHFYPLIATLITGAARLMLSLAERLATDHGLGWSLCDTDSLALARPDEMEDDEFLRRALAVTSWFDAVSPYDDRKPLFKVEDQNYRTKDGNEVQGEHEPLYALAISAKRYVLFNLNEHGRPIIRKAVAHGLGHLRAPYNDDEAPSAIPSPSVSPDEMVEKLGVKRWQYDLWHQIIMAELEGHANQIDMLPLPGLDKPAASRYSASTPALLHWFDRFNANKPPDQRVHAFNFLLAYGVSKERFNTAVAAGEIDLADFDDALPSAIAPYNDDIDEGAKACFDRRTGRSVPKSTLQTYREAVERYHIHSEAKFDNGILTDRGVTRRRHIEAIAVEYIGKEANRWEEQFYLGDMPEAQIEYGLSTEGNYQLLNVLGRAARKLGISALAERACTSRQQVTAILARDSQPRSETIKKLLQAATELEAERRAEAARHAALVQRLRTAIGNSTVTAVSKGLRYDTSNLSKAANGSRKLSATLKRKIGRQLKSQEMPQD